MRLMQGNSRLCGWQAAYAGATDRGRVRPVNEDDLLLLPEAGLFAVADGLGGLDAGDVASRSALSRLRALCPLPTVPEDDDHARQRRLAEVVADVNRHVYEHRQSLGKNMATTLALVWLVPGAALVAHVGDSRVYRWHNRELIRITDDHSLVNALYEQGALTASQARHSLQRHVITRAIGAEPTVQPSIKSVTIVPGDLLLLCTDGLTGMVTDGEIEACLRIEPADPGTIAARLVHLANEAGGHDNITVIGVMIGI